MNSGTTSGNAAVRWLVCDNVFVTSADKGAVSDTECEEILSAFVKSRSTIYLSFVNGLVLVTPAQRRRFIEAIPSKTIDIHIVTDSAIIRGMATAISWFLPRVRCYDSQHTDNALANTGLSPSAIRLISNWLALNATGKAEKSI